MPSFLTRLLELVPEAAEFFGDQDPSEALPYTRIKHFEMIVQLLDTILQLMGPDFETIGEILEQLGIRHKRMGVSATKRMCITCFLSKTLLGSLQVTLHL